MIRILSRQEQVHFKSEQRGMEDDKTLEDIYPDRTCLSSSAGLSLYHPRFIDGEPIIVEYQDPNIPMLITFNVCKLPEGSYLIAMLYSKPEKEKPSVGFCVCVEKVALKNLVRCEFVRNFPTDMLCMVCEIVSNLIGKSGGYYDFHNGAITLPKVYCTGHFQYCENNQPTGHIFLPEAKNHTETE